MADNKPNPAPIVDTSVTAPDDGLTEYFFPVEGVTIKAESLEAALTKLAEIIKNS